MKKTKYLKRNLFAFMTVACILISGTSMFFLNLSTNLYTKILFSTSAILFGLWTIYYKLEEIDLTLKEDKL